MTKAKVKARRKAARKENAIKLRVTDEQKEALARAAEKEGASLSTWLLGAGLARAARAEEG